MKVTIKRPVQITVETNTSVNTFDTTVTEEYEFPDIVQEKPIMPYAKSMQVSGDEMYEQELNTKLNALLEQREEIVRAFIAKYNCQPDEITQVEQRTPTGYIWYVTKKERTL